MRLVATKVHFHRPRQGFTLVEAALVTIIVGFGFVAMLQLLAAGTVANGDSLDLTTAMGLASNIHEMSLGVAYSDIMTLDGVTDSPPVDATNNAISGMSDWSQSISVNYVDPNHLTTTFPKSTVEPTALITVSISHQGSVVYTSDWIASAGAGGS